MRKRIHVLHLIGSTGLYGAERWILALMRATDSSKIRSTLANLIDTENEKSEIVSAALARGLSAFDFYTGGAFNPVAALRLAVWARREKVCIIHGHGFKSDAIGLLTARMAGCKVITTPHGWSMENDRRLLFYEKLDRKLFRFMDAVCPLSYELERSIIGHVRSEAIRLIYNGVDVDEVKAARQAVKNIPNCYLIGYIGRLVPLKGLNILLHAFKEVSENNSESRLMIVGDGPEKSALLQVAADLGITTRVQFLGFCPYPLEILKTFDLFVLPSFTEGIPRSVMESMAAGIPVIASDIPGNRTVIRHGETGILFAPGDSHDLANRIVNLLQNTGEARAMAIQAHRLIEQKYSGRRMAEEYSTLYHELNAGTVLSRSRSVSL